jgi:hypothetical protein
MTKVIAALMVAAVLYGSWELFLYWDKVKNERENADKQAAAAAKVVPENLQGMPYQLEPTLQAVAKDATSFKAWLKKYGPSIQDPRKAWIELDYCTLISRDNPAEAKRLFAEIKQRTAPTSPVWPRIQKMSQAYE